MQRLRHPIRAIREPFGTAGLVVACIALIAALGGTALAAAKLNSKQKKEVEKIAKKYAGKPGPAGPAGPQGAPGANGKDGVAGANGSNGAAGPTGPTGPKGPAGPAGAVGAVGATGPTGPTGTYGGIGLPAGVTETGFFSFHSPGTKTIEDGSGNPVTIGSSKVWVPISFPDRIENPFDYLVKVKGDPDFAETCGTDPNGAGGTGQDPAAPPKTLCIYIFEVSESNAILDSVVNHPANAGDPIRGISKSGALLQFSSVGEGPMKGGGSWAVTG